MPKALRIVLGARQNAQYVTSHCIPLSFSQQLLCGRYNHPHWNSEALDNLPRFTLLVSGRTTYELC